MTRGQIAIVKNPWNSDKLEVMTSIEFNGDMYMSRHGHGRTVINALKRANDVAQYQYEVAKFNLNHHHYNECDSLTFNYEGEKAIEMLDFSKNYFDNWFSDYVYIKNLTKNPITLTNGETGRPFKLLSGEIAVMCFGDLVKTIPSESNE